jgi:hypothetical protein
MDCGNPKDFEKEMGFDDIDANDFDEIGENDSLAVDQLCRLSSQAVGAKILERKET